MSSSRHKTSRKAKKEPFQGLEEAKVEQEGEASTKPLLKKAEEGSLTMDLLEQEGLCNIPEDDDDEVVEGLADYPTTEDFSLLHTLVESKLLEQQKVAEHNQQALESQLQALMNLLPTTQERIERTERSRSPTPKRVGFTPTRKPSRSPSGSPPPRCMTSLEAFSTPPAAPFMDFGNQEVLKALMRQIPDYNGNGGVIKLLEFIDKFETFQEESNLSTTLELQFATSKLTGDALVWWRQHKREFLSTSSERIKSFEELKQALVEQFAPPEYATSIRAKLRALKQSRTIRDYNTDFN